MQVYTYILYFVSKADGFILGAFMAPRMVTVNWQMPARMSAYMYQMHLRYDIPIWNMCEKVNKRVFSSINGCFLKEIDLSCFNSDFVLNFYYFLINISTFMNLLFCVEFSFLLFCFLKWTYTIAWNYAATTKIQNIYLSVFIYTVVTHLQLFTNASFFLHANFSECVRITLKTKQMWRIRDNTKTPGIYRCAFLILF